jgi:hypothetical protein
MSKAIVLVCTLASLAEATEPNREAARAILERHCGDCHRADSPQAKPAALAVFNLNTPDWSRTASDAQLRNAVGRLRNLLRANTKEPADEFRTFGGFIDPKELSLFEAFVRAELARRAKAP